MKLSTIHACVLIPTYNNARTLARVIDGVLEFSEGNDVIVVNDGATDASAEILAGYGNRIIVLNNEKNSGKGVALRKGFKEATARAFKNVITIDSDGQHYPEDINAMIEAALQYPGALLMGSRNMEHESVPGKSSFGNKFSNFWYWVETGKKLPDTQTGFRLYPLEHVEKIRLFTRKFETEIETIVKLAWRNVDVVPVNIKVLYDKEERVSHFRPFRDFTRISILNTYLVTLTLIYHLPKRLILKISAKGLWRLIKDAALDPSESSWKKALSIGFGIFFGIFPIWGFQMLAGLAFAVLFRLNKVLFIAAANISLPPLVPAIVFFSYYIGGFLVEHGMEISSLKEINLDSIHLNFVQYLRGAIALSICSGVAATFISYGLFSLKRKKTSE
jgi:glycosyltransferase involved in cell wall biosynthesis